MTANPALNPPLFGRWTLRDKAAQCRLALRQAAVWASDYPCFHFRQGLLL